MPARGVEETPGQAEALRPAAFRQAPSPLRLLRERAPFLAVVTAAGALLAALGGALLPTRYRATASLLVAEPRLASPGALDFNLTPVRSYAALAGSRALAEPCRVGSSRRAAVRVRIPEYTRIVELTSDASDAEAAAAFVNCVAARAIEENRRLNAEIAERSVLPAAAALAAARDAQRDAESRLAAARDQAGLEARRASLRAAIDAVDAGAEEERRALLSADEAAARERSFASGGTAAERNEAAAGAAGARARAQSAGQARQAAERRVAALERDVAAAEQRLETLRRSVTQAEAAVNELVKRNALAPVDAAAKGFELVLVARAVPPERPVRPPLAVFAAAGAVVALLFGSFSALSRP